MDALGTAATLSAVLAAHWLAWGPVNRKRKDGIREWVAQQGGQAVFVFALPYLRAGGVASVPLQYRVILDDADGLRKQGLVPAWPASLRWLGELGPA